MFGENPKIFIHKLNYEDLNVLGEDKFTKIITDPPWGMFDKDMDLNKFYKHMFVRFKKMMSKTGH